MRQYDQLARKPQIGSCAHRPREISREYRCVRDRLLRLRKDRQPHKNHECAFGQHGGAIGEKRCFTRENGAAKGRSAIYSHESHRIHHQTLLRRENVINRVSSVEYRIPSSPVAPWYPSVPAAG